MKVPKFVFAGFKEYFHTTTIFADTFICIVTGKYSFDVLGFEKWLVGHGYNPEAPGSMAAFVTNHFGSEARVFMQDILEL